jgi:hypothetical protein
LCARTVIGGTIGVWRRASTISTMTNISLFHPFPQRTFVLEIHYAQ